MKVEQSKWTEARGWTPEHHAAIKESAQLILVFGARSILRKKELLEHVKESYQRAHILGCSTAGEICGTNVSDDALVVTAVSFERTQIRGA